MAKMGKYCKAYTVNRFREFGDWTENADSLKEKKKESESKESRPDGKLSDNDILYLQENYVVTDGIFIDENIIFDKVTPEWKEFCSNTLQFEIPVYEPVKAKAAAQQEASSNGSQESGD